MTAEGRKFAFKKSLACGPATIVLTAIIMSFTMAKAYAANPTDLLGMSALGGTVFVTSMICTCIQYPIVGSLFKKQFSGGEKLPAMGKREEQVQFWKWIPGHWLAYNIVISAFAGILFGSGVPASLVSWGINPGGIGQLGYALLSGVINGLGTWFAVYLSQIYLVQLFNEKAAKTATAKK